MTDSTEYRHLSIAERAAIELRQRDGLSVRAIARELGRAPSSISREIRRNSGTREYLAEWAQAKAQGQRHRRGLLLDNDPTLATALMSVLAEKRSPAQAKVILEAKGLAPPSVETIYRWFYQSHLATRWAATSLMRRPRLRRRPRTRAVTGRGRIKDPVNISLRPFDPDDRTRFGDWEGDTMLGKKDATAIVTLVERKTRFTRVIPITPTTAASCEKAVLELISELGVEWFNSITWDNGKEMNNHASITQATGIPIFFCDPYSPWQRGTNENTNGVLRWQYPKSQTLNLDPEFARAVEQWLNSRPMPVLSGRTPADLFREETVALRC
jgi:IS30 family transposase